MKKYLIPVLAVLSITACRKSNDDTGKYKIADGYYMGNFVINGEKYWCEISFDSNKYAEYPSGGVIHYQKELSCLTMGTDSIVNNILTFVPDSFLFKN